MKMNVHKEMKQGAYSLKLEVTEFTPEETDKLVKFGAPMISLEPMTTVHKVEGKYESVGELPLHEINHMFFFENEKQANKFLDKVKKRVHDAMEDLRAQKDRFSQEESLEL